MTLPVAKTAESLTFLNRWSPDGPWMLTAIPPNRGKATTRTFQPGEEREMGIWIAQFQGKENLYFTVNPVRMPMDSKAKKTDIYSLNWLHVDIDPRVGEDPVEEKARALKLLESFNPPPTVITDSGNGIQGFWKLKEPVLLDGTETMAEEYEAYNQQLEVLLGGDHCHNVDRIMRLPGTINMPTEAKAKKGRVPVLSSLLKWYEEHEYDLAKFTRAARAQIKETTGIKATGEKIKISGNLTPIYLADLEAKGINISDQCKKVIAHGDDPDDPTRFPSRSEPLWYVCCELVRAGADDDTIAGVIMNKDNGISSSVLDKRRPEKYAAKQINDAREEAINPWLRKLNGDHAVISDIGGKCRIISETFDPVLGRSRISYQSFQDFLNRYMHQKVEIGKDKKDQPIEMPLGKWWVQNQHRRQYDTVVFAPGRDTPNDYNLWRGFACEAIPGDCGLFLKHIQDNICNGNKEHYDYLIGWMARAVQHPNLPGETAIVMRGEMGTGKSFFAKTFGSLFGRHFIQVSDSKHLVGSFNAHLRDCVVVFGDEAFYAGDKKHESVLKMLVTEEQLTIEGKGIDVVAAPNYTHLLMASNNQWVVPAGMRERRFFVLDVADYKIQDTEYFKAIKKQMDSGGREALLYHLMTHNIKEFNVRAAPKTMALDEQKIFSLSNEELWWLNKLENGQVFDRHDVWHSVIVKDKLHEDYVRSMQKAGVMRRCTETTLGMFLKNICPPGYPRISRKTMDISYFDERFGEMSKRKLCRVYEFPSLSECRKHWDKLHNTDHKWPAEIQENQPPLVDKPSPIE